MAFTYQYSQPEDYHFSLDSVQMPQRVAAEIFSRKNLAKNREHFRVLDLCAGCGVIGFELAWHMPQLTAIDFVEVQEIYCEHFNHNLRLVNRADLNTNFYLMNYEGLLAPEWKQKYDLVVCNPPYFVPGLGKLSPSEMKNRSRFYLDSTFAHLVEAILWTLKPDGEAYILQRSLADHALHLDTQLQELLNGRAQVQKIADIRGTDLVRIRRFFDVPSPNF